jgi:excisionase family DNA binding protein
MENLLTISEVSALLHRSKPSLNRDLAAGRLPCVRLGRSVRFRQADIERLSREGFALSANEA